MADDRWPPDFDRYETLLEMGLRAGCSARWVDPLDGSSLPEVIVDLARARPGIRLSEIARLLALDASLARTLAERVLAKEGIAIAVDI